MEGSWVQCKVLRCLVQPVAKYATAKNKERSGRPVPRPGLVQRDQRRPIVGRADHAPVGHARQVQVVDEMSLAGHLGQQIETSRSPAQDGVRFRSLGLAVRRRVRAA